MCNPISEGSALKRLVFVFRLTDDVLDYLTNQKGHTPTEVELEAFLTGFEHDVRTQRSMLERAEAHDKQVHD